MSDKELTCTNCGASLPAGALTCENCGTSVASTMRLPMDELQEPKAEDWPSTTEPAIEKSYETVKVEEPAAVLEPPVEDFATTIRTESPVEVPAEYLEIPESEAAPAPAVIAPVPPRQDVFTPFTPESPAPKKSNNGWVIALVVILVLCCFCACLGIGAVAAIPSIFGA